MKNAIFALAVVVCLGGQARGESAQVKGVWLRRVTLIASCAASFWDLQTTRTAVRYGALEGNGFLADQYGRPRWGRMISLKVGLCAATAAAQEFHLLSRRHETLSNRAWTAANALTASFFIKASLNNRDVAERLRRTAAAPACLVCRIE